MDMKAHLLVLTVLQAKTAL